MSPRDRRWLVGRVPIVPAPNPGASQAEYDSASKIRPGSARGHGATSGSGEYASPPQLFGRHGTRIGIGRRRRRDFRLCHGPYGFFWERSFAAVVEYLDDRAVSPNLRK